jgi:haloacetate dehalogenase
VSLFPGFDRRRVGVGDVSINLVIGGDGPPVLLLHGYPQTLAMWHRVAPALARSFTVVATDLRGYGDSSKPPGDERHERYSKRAMAADQVSVMAALGFDRFAMVGHDRGGRVAHRLAIDHPGAVTAAAVLDIVPTRTVLRSVDRHVAAAYYHWFLLAQPDGLPERLVGNDPIYFLHRILGGLGTAPAAFAQAAVAEYERCFDGATIHASCEDYRAAASIDLEHDDADVEAGRLVACPLLVLWGERGRMHGLFDVLATWEERAIHARGRALPCGHFLAEERPEETAAALLDFLR